MGKNRSHIDHFIDEAATEQELEERPDYDDYDYRDADELRLQLMLAKLFRIWRFWKARITEDDYSNMRDAAICHMWREYDDTDLSDRRR